MQNKNKSRHDAQWIISSISLALTFGLWGTFASQEKRGASVSGQVNIAPPPDQQVVVSQPALLVPGQKILFGGTAPQPQQQVTITKTTRHRGDGGGGGGGGGGATSTGSSKP